MSNSQEELDLVFIEPDKEYQFPIPDNISTLLQSLPEEEKELVVCRVSISDQAGFGVLIPAFLNPENQTEFFFTLPDQLCIFSPKLSYLLKMELILPTQLITPFIQTIKIAPGAFIEPEKSLDGSEDVEKIEGANEARSASQSDSGKLIDEMMDNTAIDPELEMALDVIAPLPILPAAKRKVTLEELDEDFVKHALWNVPVKPSPSVLIVEEKKQENPSSSVLKRKMKDLFR